MQQEHSIPAFVAERCHGRRSLQVVQDGVPFDGLGMVFVVVDTHSRPDPPQAEVQLGHSRRIDALNPVPNAMACFLRKGDSRDAVIGGKVPTKQKTPVHRGGTDILEILKFCLAQRQWIGCDRHTEPAYRISISSGSLSISTRHTGG